MRIALLAIMGVLLAQGADHEVSGRVVDATTGEPIARAHVTVHFFQGNQPSTGLTLVTDADGMFRISNMPDGGYQIVCDKAGYLSANQGMPPMASGKAAPVVLKLIAQAAVEGTVVDDRDQPAQNVQLQLVMEEVVNGRRQWRMAQTAGTDETGSFRIFGVPAGRYYVSVFARFNSARKTKPLAYPSLFYPNATDIAGAQPLDLKAGDEAQIKVRLPQPVPSFEVRGEVPAAGQNVSVTMSREMSYLFQAAPADVTWDPKSKTFRFSHVTPGTYTIQVTLPQDGKPGGLVARRTVTVNDADVTGIRLEPIDVSGTGVVRMEGDASQRRISGYVVFRSDRSSASGPVDPDGKFRVSTQPGTYHITPQINLQQACVRSVLSGGQDVRDNFTVADAAPPAPIEIAMTTHCGSVEVTLAPSDSPLPANLTAYLLRKGGDELVLEKQGYRNNGANHFFIPTVPAGEYIVYVWPADLAIEYANAEYMKQFESYGQRVTVTEDGKATVTLDKALTTLVKN